MRWESHYDVSTTARVRWGVAVRRPGPRAARSGARVVPYTHPADATTFLRSFPSSSTAKPCPRTRHPRVSACLALPSRRCPRLAQPAGGVPDLRISNTSPRKARDRWLGVNGKPVRSLSSSYRAFCLSHFFLSIFLLVGPVSLLAPWICAVSTAQLPSFLPLLLNLTFFFPLGEMLITPI